MQATVLVADDDDAIRELLAMLLSEAGYTILSAADGKKAVELAIEHQPDIAVLDVMMPVMDGFEACRLIKADPRTANTPVLLLTALNQTRSKVQGLEDGATDYITKPFENQELLARLRTALTEKSRRDALAAEALTDPLTSLTNRRGLEQSLDQLLAHTFRTNEALSVLLFDADHFKQVNDTYGHETGDIVLATLAHRAQETMRSQDVVGRFGGEEFLAILPSAGRQAAFTAAERLRTHIGGVPIETPGGLITVTVSVGAATNQPDIDTDRATLVAAADQALYSAKHAGRNRVVHADGRPTALLTMPEPPESARALLEALAILDAPTAEHARAVSQLCWDIGSALQLAPEERTRIALAGLLHDVGKITARRTSFHPLDPVDKPQKAKSYIQKGEALVRHIPALASTAELIGTQHAHWDGSGFPATLRGEEIPLGSRIIAVSSIYDAVRRDDGHNSAATNLQSLSGTYFDPAVVACALKIITP